MRDKGNEANLASGGRGLLGELEDPRLARSRLACRSLVGTQIGQISDAGLINREEGFAATEESGKNSRGCERRTGIAQTPASSLGNVIANYMFRRSSHLRAGEPRVFEHGHFADCRR